MNVLSSVCLWSVNKKKPLTTVKQAHGCHGDAGLEQPHWVSSVAALHNSDTVASGASGCERPPSATAAFAGRDQRRLIGRLSAALSGPRSIKASLLVSSTGSHNSQVQVWKCQLNYRGLEPLFSVPLVSVEPGNAGTRSLFFFFSNILLALSSSPGSSTV